ncbi:hypothetical protein [Streptomyces viridosporus]|uniref:hypothetical protein n=1 Tax=Streptomyces viridosporus TaxID=67581 RepID=UPI0009BE2EDA|nr:hypothetical protein [Streptomyces viridosporus]
MRYVVAGVFACFFLAVAVSGVVGLLTGWIHPWERPRVLRLVPHGLGQVLTGSGMTCFTAVLAFLPVGDALISLLAGGACLLLAGTVLLGVARFPDRG